MQLWNRKKVLFNQGQRGYDRRGEGKGRESAFLVTSPRWIHSLTTLLPALIVNHLICCNNSLNDFSLPMYPAFRTTLIFLKLYIHNFIQLAQELIVLPFCSRYKFYLPSKTSQSSYLHLLEHSVGQFFKSLFIANVSISYMCIHEHTCTHTNTTTEICIDPRGMAFLFCMLSIFYTSFKTVESYFNLINIYWIATMHQSLFYIKRITISWFSLLSVWSIFVFSFVWIFKVLIVYNLNIYILSIYTLGIL